MFAPREFECTCRNHTKTKKVEFVGDVFMSLRFKSPYHIVTECGRFPEALSAVFDFYSQKKGGKFGFIFVF